MDTDEIQEIHSLTERDGINKSMTKMMWWIEQMSLNQ